jgi:hypothetical protein
VSYNSDAQFEWFIDDAIDRRTVAEIRRKIIKQGKRNAVSRLVHAKNDKDTITTWRSDLNRILLVFNVRSVVFVWSLLTVHSQTELAINMHGTVSDTHAIVTDIHRAVVKGQDGTDGQHPSVSIACPLFIAE